MGELMEKSQDRTGRGENFRFKIRRVSTDLGLNAAQKVTQRGKLGDWWGPSTQGQEARPWRGAL